MIQLAKTVKDVTIFGVCSKSKHEALKNAGAIDHLLERGADYSNEVRKYVDGVARNLYNIFCFLPVENIQSISRGLRENFVRFSYVSLLV